MKYINPEQIVKAEFFERKYGLIEYRRERRFLIFSDPAGYWNVGGDSLLDYHGAWLPEGFAIDEGGAYRKPNVRVSFSDGSKEQIYFGTDKEALAFLSNLVSKSKLYKI